jgi:hypothetical protein
MQGSNFCVISFECYAANHEKYYIYHFLIFIGLMMTILYMDNPRGYICRVRRSKMLEIPDKEENLPTALTILAAVLNIKVFMFNHLSFLLNDEQLWY